MTFPAVTNSATGRTTASNVTSHPITIPTGSVGERLLVVFSSDGNPTVTVGTGTGWTKVGQASNGNTVTGALFTKIADGSDTLTLTTSASEQSSHVVYRLSGAPQITATSSNGSSTNADPPNHTVTAGTQDVLWIVTRSGDSTVVATTAPASFDNLQTIAAAGTAGASTNTAIRSLAASSLDPGGFTSANEQWVSWTISTYTWQVAQTLSATYTASEAVPKTLSATYQVLAVDAGGSAWFARITDGANTWSTYAAGALVVSAPYSVVYQAGGRVSSVFTVDYRVGDQVSGYNTSWFPRLDGGANTWAGETLAADTGEINGGGAIPYQITTTYSATYSAKQSVPASRSVFYQTLNRISQTFSAEYLAAGKVSSTLSATYTVVDPASASYSVTYTVQPPLTAVSKTFSATYGVYLPVSRSTSAQYNVFNISSVSNTVSGTYDVINSVASSLSAEFTVGLTGIAQTLEVVYDTLSGVGDDLEVIYQCAGLPSADLSVEYTIGSATPTSLKIDMYRYGRAGVKR